MSEEKQDKIRYCAYCGHILENDRIYCPKCGKLSVKIKSSNHHNDTLISKTHTPSPEIPERVCANCGSIIKSMILNQCPICNTKLKEIPKENIEKFQEKKPGFLFTGNKLVSEKELKISEDSWNFKEGLSVFSNSILLFITGFFFIIVAYSFTYKGDTPPENIYNLIVFSLPEILFGILPIWYISSKNHSFQKLKLDINKKKIAFIVIIGIITGISLYLINIFSDFLIQLFINLGLENILPIKDDIEANALIINNAEIYWIIMMMIINILSSISIEILFRGVLQNTLKTRYKNGLIDKLIVISLTTLAYTIIFSLFSYEHAIYFIPYYLLINFVLGIIFEYSGSLYTTIIAQCFLNVFSLIVIYFNLF